jgi:hypothetical protein
VGRVIGSVVVGYIVMAVVVFCLHTAAWFGLGANGAFQPGTFDPSVTWVAVTLFAGLVAALGGGWVAAIIAKGDQRALWGLIGLVVVLGILYAVPILTRGDVASVARRDTITMMEAMQNARTPAWLALMNPVLGVVGSLVGFRLRKTPNPLAVAA